jgi:tryptophan-rich sensory protein
MSTQDPVSEPRPPAIGLALALLLAVTVSAALGGLATSAGVQTWYTALDRPPWNPPNWVFGPIWTTLYLAMTVAAWDIARGRWAQVRVPMTLYATQLALNTLWSPMFFAWQQVGLALIVMTILWATILACILAFRPYSKMSAMLMVPYLVWVSIAWSLNAWIYWYN